MPNLTRKKAARKVKPRKPRPDFPLYPHAVGKWAKTIEGKTYYFGTWDDPESALQDYLDQTDELKAGRTPEAKGGVTLREICNAFMRSKRTDLDVGKLSPRTFAGYDATLRNLLDEMGASRNVADLKPTDFEKLYAKLARKHGLTTLGREITVTRSVFKYAWECDLIKQSVKFGPKFKAPSKTDKRKAKARAARTNGKRTFEPTEIRKLIDAASVQLKAMILLGINAGLGNTDCANLPIGAIDIDRGWIDYPRRKTGVERTFPLWPETAEALREAMAKRRTPQDPADEDTLFLTRLGQRWVRFSITEVTSYGKKRIASRQDDAIAKAFAKLLGKLDLKHRGLGFYRLRHTFETVAGGSKDQMAVDHVMGHADPTMAAEYRHGIEESRLQAVVDHVHSWLYNSDVTRGDA